MNGKKYPWKGRPLGLHFSTCGKSHSYTIRSILKKKKKPAGDF